MRDLLRRNVPCTRALSFLGAGCYQHHVPAVCDEINGRAEFLTAYAGEPYEDHGRFQALFEYQSLMGELLDCEVVNVPAMDGAQAAATALRMAQRITGRGEALVAADIHPDVRRAMENYCAPGMTMRPIPFDVQTGALDRTALEAALSDDTACVYLQMPSFLGVVPDGIPEIARLAHAAGAELIVGCDPSLLGILESPMNLGADIAVGDIQPLGMHMNYGGGQGGFIATRDEPKYVLEYPSRLFGVARTRVEGEYGFGDVAYGRTSFADREGGKEYVGTQAALWGVTAGVYLALMGPDGMEALGDRMIVSAHYLGARLAKLPGVSVRFAGYANELVVDFSGSGRTVAELSAALLAKGIYLGYDLTKEFPELGQCALMCCTEVHEKADLDYLIQALQEEVGA